MGLWALRLRERLEPFEEWPYKILCVCYAYHPTFPQMSPKYRYLPVGQTLEKREMQHFQGTFIEWFWTYADAQSPQLLGGLPNSRVGALEGVEIEEALSSI